MLLQHFRYGGSRVTHPIKIHDANRAASAKRTRVAAAHAPLRRPFKRLIDIILSLAALIFLAPVLVSVWGLVRLTSEGPGLFWSERVGLGGQTFMMPKFRTMRVSAPVVRREELAQPGRFDTPIGRALRVTSIDELPQLWSVLKGDMSLVGPRPVLPTDRTAVERAILGCPLTVRPGITGLAQIRGRNGVTPRKKARYDALYARKCSIKLDAEIKLKTVSYVLRKKGVL